jgi:hypothetical protein
MNCAARSTFHAKEHALLVMISAPGTVSITLTQGFEDCEALQDPVEAARRVSGASGRMLPFQSIELFALEFGFLLDHFDELVEVTAHARFSMLVRRKNARPRIWFPHGASCVALR